MLDLQDASSSGWVSPLECTKFGNLAHKAAECSSTDCVDEMIEQHRTTEGVLGVQEKRRRWEGITSPSPSLRTARLSAAHHCSGCSSSSPGNLSPAAADKCSGLLMYYPVVTSRLAQALRLSDSQTPTCSPRLSIRCNQRRDMTSIAWAHLRQYPSQHSNILRVHAWDCLLSPALPRLNRRH
ncbi:hypothetical protein K402DRAFT_430472 [Aulographum hederae CBS 113979]|uniref:Uncharacterized protein n=1 Tax=Aulographum hederae CBS 113979 TaxID=1176131 RepID=A0A6G1HFB5_9PEZI|nr:hypothetical protein K402DRAFT_430472 [Aulographum hederae CBS 113979]